MDARTDYYAVLGVPLKASQDDVRKAFRRLAKQYHPDRNPGNAASEAKFKEVNEANTVLSDPKKRAEYDAMRKGGGRAFSGGPPPGAGGFRWDSPPPNFGDASSVFGGRGDFSDILGDLVRGQGGGRSAAKGRDVAVDLSVPFLDMARGMVTPIRYRRPSVCAQCSGTGRAGRKGCPRCYGQGVTDESTEVKIRIPAGAQEGATIRVPGKGEAVDPPSEPGDLLVTLRTVPHPFFRSDGKDLVLDLPVNFSEAVLGAKMEIPTIDGPLTLTLPPGISSGRKLRIKGRGLPAPTGGEPGDLYVVVQVVVPASDTDDFRKLVEKLSAFEEKGIRARLSGVQQ